MDSSQRLVTRKADFNLPTACPTCLPVFIYLKMAQIDFQLDFDSKSDKLPFFDSGTSLPYYNNEKGDIIERLTENGIADLDSNIPSSPELHYIKVTITSCLEYAALYELWVGSDGGSAYNIYYSHLHWLIGNLLFLKRARAVKQKFEITKSTAEIRKQQIYKSANEGYKVLSARLATRKFLFGDSPSSLDAFLLGNVLFTLRALPETSVLRSKLLEHRELINYAHRHSRFVEFGESSQSSPVSSASAIVRSKWNTKIPLGLFVCLKGEPLKWLPSSIGVQSNGLYRSKLSSSVGLSFAKYSWINAFCSLSTQFSEAFSVNIGFLLGRESSVTLRCKGMKEKKSIEVEAKINTDFLKVLGTDLLKLLRSKAITKASTHILGEEIVKEFKKYLQLISERRNLTSWKRSTISIGTSVRHMIYLSAVWHAVFALRYDRGLVNINGDFKLRMCCTASR